MPNWCSNTLIVTGRDVAKFREENAGEQALSFEKVLPTPHFEEGDDGWYKWRCENWSTKWDANDVDLEEGAGSLNYFFSTAWAPPFAWLTAASKKYPNLSFSMQSEEGGCGIYCVTNVQDGEVDQIDYDAYEYYYAFNDDFKHLVDQIKNAPYDDFLTLANEPCEEEPFCMAEIDIVNRIEDKDLPLFVAHEWLSNSATTQFQQRLMGETKCKELIMS
jgi:hypothetical protein